MPRYLYKAKKEPKEVLEGSIEADSENAAINKLTESNCYPISVREETVDFDEKSKGIFLFSKRIKTRDLADFTRQLSELLDSGLALFDALNILENQTAISQLKDVIRDVRDRIKGGSTFSEALKSRSRIFSDLYVNLVKSGEAGGVLGEVLANISDFLEKEVDTRSRIMAALSYPLLMVAVGFISIFILLGFVIPKLTNMLVEMGETLPLPTSILIGLSDIIRNYWILLLVLIGGLVFFVKGSKKNKVVRLTVDSLKLKLPIFGALIRHGELARFSRTLSTLLKNGVPMLYSIKITSDVIDNGVIKRQIEEVHNDVKSGFSLHAAVKKDTDFPLFLINMIAVGEEGGSLDRTLFKVAKAYETETDRMIKILSSLMEPVIILVMGLVVGFIVVSMLLPVFQISLTVH